MALDLTNAPLFKAWLVKRLEALEASSRTDSDVDADILAEYVVALLQHDTSSADAKQMCRSELYDFLKDETGSFVDEVFEALSLKSYLPGAPQPSKKPTSKPLPPAPTNQNPRAGAGHGYGALQPPVASGSTVPPTNGSKKRSYNESSLPAVAVPGGAGALNSWGAYVQGTGDRAAKQPRRGGGAGARGGRGGGGHGAAQPDFATPAHSGLVTASLPQYAPAPGTFNPGAAVFYPGGLPAGGAGMPANGLQPFFDGNSPVPAHLVENLMRMQQQLELALSSYNAFAAPAAGGQRTKRPKRVRRCRNLEKKGVCNKTNCRFDHTPAGAQVGFAVAHQQLPRGGSKLSADAKKATIVVQNIPDEFLDEGDVRNHFSIFGIIVVVMIQRENRTATVEFDTPAAALKAVTSPKTIFDNRFVTVSRLGDEKPQQQLYNQSGYGDYEGEEEGEVREVTPELDMEAFLRKQEALQKEHDEKKRLLDELAEQQQSIDDRLKSNLAKQLELRKKIVANMSARSARLKRDDSQQSGGGGGGDDGASGTESPSSSKSAAQALQTELIRAQLATLETEAKLLGIDPDMILGDDPSTPFSSDDRSASFSAWPPPRGRGYGRGRAGGFAPRGRGGGGGRGGGRGGYQPGSMSLVYAAYSLDNRPRRVAVAGCDFTDPAKGEALRQYLLGVGDFSAIDMTDDAATITFGDRRTAETFFYGLPRAGAAAGSSASADSKSIPGIDEPVELSWVAGAVPASSGGSGSAAQAGKDHNGAGGVGPFIMEVEDDDLEEGEEREEGKEERREEEDRRNRTRLQRQNMDFDVADEGDWDLQ